MKIFEQYDDPKKALRVWYSYEEDMTAHPERRMKAVSIAQECRSADSLDARLDILLGKVLHFAGNDAPSLNDIDEDCNGCLSNARKALEEG